MKRGIKISIHKEKIKNSEQETLDDEWLSGLNRLVHNGNTSVIDTNDEKTRY